MTEEVYLTKAIQANKDISEGKVTEHQDLKEESENW